MSYKLITSEDSAETKTLIVLIYGEAGIGKTSLTFTTESPLLFDFDAGIQRTCFRKDAVRIEKWEDLIDFQKSKEFKELKPKTLIIDTAGAMLDNYLAEYVKNIDPKNRRRGGELSLQGYGAMKDIFYQFKNWAKTQNCNLIFIAHATTQEEGDNLKFIPKITGGSADILRQECDLIGYMYSNRNQRVIDFNPTDQHIGKNCAEIPLTTLPHYTDSEYQVFMQMLIDSTLEKMNSLSQSQIEAIKTLEAFKKNVKGLKTIEKFNSTIDEIKEIKVKAIQLQMFDALKNHAEFLGFTYNVKSKKFEG